jgi:hypothetical protein
LSEHEQGTLTGRTIRSGFPCAPPAPSPLAALRIISLACFRLTPLSAPIWPSWISARLNGWNVGTGGRVDINTIPLRVKGRARFEVEKRDRDTENPRQQSICEFPQTFLLVWSSRHSKERAPSRADDGRHHSRCLKHVALPYRPYHSMSTSTSVLSFIFFLGLVPKALIIYTNWPITNASRCLGTCTCRVNPSTFIRFSCFWKKKGEG